MECKWERGRGRELGEKLEEREVGGEGKSEWGKKG